MAGHCEFSSSGVIALLAIFAVFLLASLSAAVGASPTTANHSFRALATDTVDSAAVHIASSSAVTRVVLFFWDQLRTINYLVLSQSPQLTLRC
jgi:hypothetical protein